MKFYQKADTMIIIIKSKITENDPQSSRFNVLVFVKLYSYVDAGSSVPQRRMLFE